MADTVSEREEGNRAVTMTTRENGESLKGDAVGAQPCKHTQVLTILQAI